MVLSFGTSTVAGILVLAEVVSGRFSSVGASDVMSIDRRAVFG